ncbi:ferredoxin [Nocardia miyunensis]|uniref:ferredoxin n=1 Tax=Nocardia miyunensis TaxID=282684 RepID=UPI000835769C|nr:ferredoxin [Nocardia miyunensis]
MKVVVDHTLCEANALCVEAAPHVFELDEDVLRIARPVPPSEQERAVRFAVASCPKQALRVMESGQ